MRRRNATRRDAISAARSPSKTCCLQQQRARVVREPLASAQTWMRYLLLGGAEWKIPATAAMRTESSSSAAASPLLLR